MLNAHQEPQWVQMLGAQKLLVSHSWEGSLPQVGTFSITNEFEHNCASSLTWRYDRWGLLGLFFSSYLAKSCYLCLRDSDCQQPAQQWLQPTRYFMRG